MSPLDERGPASQPSPQEPTTAEEIVRLADGPVKDDLLGRGVENFWTLAASGKVAGRTWTSSDHAYTSRDSGTTSHSHSGAMRAMEFNIDLIERRERRKGSAA